MAKHAAKEDIFERRGDRRYKQDPVIKEVAYLSVKKSRGWTRGTGFLVNIEGQFIVLTAAHCLYDEETRDVARRVEVYFGRSTEDEMPAVTKVLEDIYVHPLYRPVSGEDSEQDFGFIYLGKEEHFAGFEAFELMFLDTAKLSKQSKATVITGYPAERSLDAPEKFHQYSVKLTNIHCNPKRRFLTYKDATSGGMSGSPLYFTSPMGRFAFAIHVNAENGAVWMTKDEISLIEKAVLRAALGGTVAWQHHEAGKQSIKEDSLEHVQRKMEKRLALFSDDGTGKGPSKNGDISCVHLKYDLQKVHIKRHINSNGELVNKHDTDRPSGNTSKGFQNYKGTTSTAPLSKSQTLQYVELLSDVMVDKPLEERDIVLNTGVCREQDRDVHSCIPDREYCYSLSVSQCPQHNSVCTMIWKDGEAVHHLPDTLPNTAGSRTTLHHGVVFDSTGTRIVFLDVKKMKVIGALDNVDYTQSMWPMFGVYNPGWVRVSMKLVAGNDIDMTPEKKALILKAM